MFEGLNSERLLAAGAALGLGDSLFGGLKNLVRIGLGLGKERVGVFSPVCLECLDHALCLGDLLFGLLAQGIESFLYRLAEL